MATSILMYHSIDEGDSPISISPRTFEQQMEILYRGGYKVLSLTALVTALRDGEEPPEKSVVLTFDDGLGSVYTSAWPVLERFGFPATVFLVSDYCDKTNDWPSQSAGIPRFAVMSWQQIREMDQHGVEFGAHTATHPRLDQVPQRDLENEVVQSKTVIEDRLGHPINLFSYPYGRISEASAELVGQMYQGACTTKLGIVSAKSDPRALERVDIHYVKQVRKFKMLSTPALSAYLSLRRPLRAVASSVLGREWG